jgi:serine protease inhibitor
MKFYNVQYRKQRNERAHFMKKFILYIIMAAAVLSAVSCGIIGPNITGEIDNQDTGNVKIPTAEHLSAVNLMKNVSAGSAGELTADMPFIMNTADFAVDLFKEGAGEEKNPMISPLSVLLALSMTANGADGDTLAQMEDVLGGTLDIDSLNKFLRGYINSLKNTDKAALSVANSVWFRNEENSIAVDPEFLQNAADYYGADAYAAAFDSGTLEEINNWVSEKTDGLIDSILEKIPDEAVMYLINAMVFDAEWQDVYSKEEIRDGTFHAYDGTEQTVPMMYSREIKYLDDGRATGFLKPYADGQYSFAALLPNTGISIGEYIAAMTGEDFIKTIENAKTGIVNAALPKFTSEYSIQLNDVLKNLGITDAFSETDADFTRLGQSAAGNIYISGVAHKTYISVDELGTKAGAVTSVEMSVTSLMPVDFYTVTLDRPFVYAIIDNSTNLPLFIGAVHSIGN